MAPEQLLAESVDARSDLYSVGVVLYECLTGSPPFEAKSVISLIAKVLNEVARAPEVLKPRRIHPSPAASSKARPRSHSHDVSAQASPPRP